VGSACDADNDYDDHNDDDDDHHIIIIEFS